MREYFVQFLKDTYAKERPWFENHLDPDQIALFLLEKYEIGAYFNEVLDDLALEGLRSGTNHFTRVQVATAAGRVMKAYGFDESRINYEIPNLFSALDTSVGTLVISEPDHYMFWPYEFQRYYAVRKMLKEANPIDIVQNWDDPEWGYIWYLYMLGISENLEKVEYLFKIILENAQPELDVLIFRPQVRISFLAGINGVEIPDDNVSWQKVQNWICQELTGESWRCEIAINALILWEKKYPRQIIDALLKLIEENNIDTGNDAAERLKRNTADPSLQMDLLRLSQHKYENVRSNAIKALVLVSNHPAVKVRLLEALKDPSASVRSSAAESLESQSSDPSVKAALLETLKDPDARARLQSVYSLYSEVSDPVVQKSFFNALQDEDAAIIECIIESFVHNTSNYNAKELFVQASKNSLPAIRQVAIAVLGWKFDDPIAENIVFQALDDKNLKVRQTAIKALVSEKSNYIVENILLEKLNDKNPSIRIATLDNLRSAKYSPEIRLAIINRLTDENIDVRHKTIKVLGQRSLKPVVRTILIDILKNDTNVVSRRYAVSGLARKTLNKIVKAALHEALKDEDDMVRWTAAMDLDPYDTVVKVVLLEALSSNDYGMCIDAAYALRSQLDDPIVLEGFIKTLKNENSKVGFSIIEKLEVFARALRLKSLNHPA